MNVKVIKSNEDYAAAMARLSTLMSIDPNVGTEEENELELLALVIEDYERQVVPPAAPDPVDAIMFRMDQMKLNRKDLISYIGSISKVSEVLSRKRPLSLSMIRRLHKGLGIAADVLIGDAEGDRAAISEEPDMDFARFPLKEMLDRGCFGDFKGNVQKLKDYAEDLVRGFMQDLLPKELTPAFLRAPMHQRKVRDIDSYALLAWRMCVLRRARETINVREYKKGTVTSKWLKELAKLSAFEEGPKLAKEHLGRHGITLVIEPHFKKTFLDGAAMLDGKRPVVALTLRHDRVDNFWFALMHELVHVGRHLNEENPFFADDLDRQDQLDRIESEADEMSTDALIPDEVWAKAAIRTSLSASDALALADKLGIHVAIVAGRLRHETKNYRVLSQLIGGSGQVSKHFIQ